MCQKKEEEFELRDLTARLFKLQKIGNVRGALGVHQRTAVRKCLFGLYHTSLRELHNHNDEIVICAKDWEMNEVIALDVIFVLIHLLE
ncbi:10294_t:CDS:2 [Gigaspora rosea]|nr:10294_t:CDS:2 [Gigaspora rosea]